MAAVVERGEADDLWLEGTLVSPVDAENSEAVDLRPEFADSHVLPPLVNDGTSLVVSRKPSSPSIPSLLRQHGVRLEFDGTSHVVSGKPSVSFDAFAAETAWVEAGILCSPW